MYFYIFNQKKFNKKRIYEPGGEEFFNKLWSYDGKRFQWSDTETLVFDPSKIRDIKLEEIFSS